MAFVPQRCRGVGEDERPVVTLASATHDIEGVRLERAPESLVRYALRPYDELRSHAAPGRRPPQRLRRGAAASAGSPARQWGRQPTAASRATAFR